MICETGDCGQQEFRDQSGSCVLCKQCGPGMELSKVTVGCVGQSYACVFIYTYLLICLDASGLGYGTRDLLLQCENSVVVAYRFSCSAACGILVSRPGIEHGSPELQGGFSTMNH